MKRLDRSYYRERINPKEDKGKKGGREKKALKKNFPLRRIATAQREVWKRKIYFQQKRKGN